jgi:hypothetical protein
LKIGVGNKKASGSIATEKPEVPDHVHLIEIPEVVRDVQP